MNMLFKDMRKVIAELAVKKQRLLYQTNHDELLKACRLIIKRFNDNVFSKAKIDIRDDKFAKDLKHIPEIILNLEPVYVWFRKDFIMVALMGGMGHAGVIAYQEGSEQIASDDSFQIIDGLWYYDDGLREADDDYIDYIKSLENEAITYGEWKRKQTN